MPSSNTHGYFCEDVLIKCNSNVKNKLTGHINYFKVFGQGPDPYFFYDFHLTNRGKLIYKINRNMQKTNINKHFIKLINYINEKNYYSNNQVMAYLYGQICHYALDTTCHPYIIYYTGIYNKNNPNTYKYNGLHEEMEYYIDTYFIFLREKIRPRKYKVYKHLFDIGKFNFELKDTIDNVMKEVYNVDNASSIYYKSIMDMKKFYFVFNYDRYGIKKLVYKIMDFICGNSFVKKQELSFFVNPNSKLFYLNTEKEGWNNPCDINDKYNFSFDELYSNAIDKASNIINIIDNMLFNKKIDNDLIATLFKNLNYGTGKDCNFNDKYVYKYFRF